MTQDADQITGPTKHNRTPVFELLVLSEAGKPIYSYSKRPDAVTLMPLCSALMNYALRAQKETLISMKTSENLEIVFTTRAPLVIVILYEINSCIDPLVIVDQVEAQILSILTAKTLKSVFEDRSTFDLKRLLYGSEKLIDSISSLSASEVKLQWPFVEAFLAVTSSTADQANASHGILNQPSGSISLPLRPHRVLVPIAAMPQSIRENIHSFIISAVSANTKNMVFSLLFKLSKGGSAQTEKSSSNDSSSGEDSSDDQPEDVSFKLLTVCCHHNRHKLKIPDIHIILALLDGSRAQLATVESLWMPVCLPRFNQDAFLHSYISYINGRQRCLVLLSVDRDEFNNCQKVKLVIEDKLNSLDEDSSLTSKLNYRLSPLVHPLLLELQEKLMSQTLSDDESQKLQQQMRIYNSKLELYHARQLQFVWYQTSRQVLWWQRSHESALCPILYYVTQKMLDASLKTLWLKLDGESVILGWHVPSFQLYAQFDITVTSNEATEVVQRITNWIKKEEENFHIKDLA